MAARSTVTLTCFLHGPASVMTTSCGSLTTSEVMFSVSVGASGVSVAIEGGSCAGLAVWSGRG